jgi:hypothetical protein
MSNAPEKDELQPENVVAVPPEALDDEPPNGGYGWVVCFVRLGNPVLVTN